MLIWDVKTFDRPMGIGSKRISSLYLFGWILLYRAQEEHTY